MKGFSTFMKKEITELIRTRKLMIILGVFVIFGIMNPAVAKLTPKMFEMMSDTYSAQGIRFEGEYIVTALDSWSQFASNIPMALIVLLIMFCGIYTTEYTKGTLIPLLTKGLSRSSVVVSKFTVMLLVWTVGISLCYGITYCYSEYFWDNSVVAHLFFAGLCWWVFGLLLISCIVFFSSFGTSTAYVMLGTGSIYFVMTILGMFGKIKKYLPVFLTDSLSIYKGIYEPSDYLFAICLTFFLSVVLIIASLPLTYRRQL